MTNNVSITNPLWNVNNVWYLKRLHSTFKQLGTHLPTSDSRMIRPFGIGVIVLFRLLYIIEYFIPSYPCLKHIKYWWFVKIRLISSVKRWIMYYWTRHALYGVIYSVRYQGSTRLLNIFCLTCSLPHSLCWYCREDPGD